MKQLLLQTSLLSSAKAAPSRQRVMSTRVVLYIEVVFKGVVFIIEIDLVLFDIFCEGGGYLYSSLLLDK